MANLKTKTKLFLEANSKTWEAEQDNIILQNEEFAIDMEWSGIMAFGSSKEPIIKKLSDRSVLAVRLGGIGVSISSILGKEASELLL